MHTAKNSIAEGLLAFSESSAKVQFASFCAWGLSHRRRVKTAGQIKARCADGRTYCFSTESAKEAFLMDSAENASKAKVAYGYGRADG